MDYSEDKEIMKVLSSLAIQVEGLNYTLNSKWSNDEQLVKHRKATVNETVDKLKKLLSGD